MDYKFLYFEEKAKNEINRRKIQELEARQTVLEETINKFSKFKRDLESTYQDAKKQHEKIQKFLSSFLPEYGFSNKNSEPINTRRKEIDEKDAYVPPQVLISEKKIYEDSDDDSGISPDAPPESSKLPLPGLEYVWCENRISNLRSVRWLPRGGYSIRSPSFSTQTDELNLCFQFDVDSRHLPSKLLLEVRDSKTGNLVYRKKQNIYYVKIQEKVSILDSSKDYVLTMTTITSEDENSRKVTIRNKRYKELEDKVLNTSKATEKILEDGIDEVVEEEIQTFHHHSYIYTGKEETPSLLTEDKDSRLYRIEKISSPIVLRRASNTSPCVLSKKPVVPSIRAKIQNCFRPVGFFNYVKKAIFKLKVEFDSEVELLPTELRYSIVDQKTNNEVQVEVRSVHANISNFEFTPPSPNPGSYQIRIKNSERNAEFNYTIPEMTIDPRCGTTEWKEVYPILNLENFNKIFNKRIVSSKER